MQAARFSVPTGLLSFWSHRRDLSLASLADTYSQLINSHLHQLLLPSYYDHCPGLGFSITPHPRCHGNLNPSLDCPAWCTSAVMWSNCRGTKHLRWSTRSQSTVLHSTAVELLDSQGRGPRKRLCIPVSSSSSSSCRAHTVFQG